MIHEWRRAKAAGGDTAIAQIAVAYAGFGTLGLGVGPLLALSSMTAVGGALG